MSDIYTEGATFEVICKRCSKKFEVIRNWGGGIRRDRGSFGQPLGSNPAICNCGSRQLEIF
jgi:hypothetical protein